MVVTRKYDSSPRRTVDLSALIKICQRETFAMEPPFQLARRIPKDTWKSVTDAWNGYHSVPLRMQVWPTPDHFNDTVRALALRNGTSRFPVIRRRQQPPGNSTLFFQPSSAKNVASIQSTTTPTWNNTGGVPSTCLLALAKQALC